MIIAKDEVRPGMFVSTILDDETGRYETLDYVNDSSGYFAGEPSYSESEGEARLEHERVVRRVTNATAPL